MDDSTDQASHEASITSSTEPGKVAIFPDNYQTVFKDGLQNEDFMFHEDVLHPFSNTSTLLKACESIAISRYPTGVYGEIPSSYTEFTDTSSEFGSWESSSSKNQSAPPSSLSAGSFLLSPRPHKRLLEQSAPDGERRPKCVSCIKRRLRCRGLGPDCPRLQKTAAAFERSEERLEDGESPVYMDPGSKLIRSGGQSYNVATIPLEMQHLASWDDALAPVSSMVSAPSMLSAPMMSAPSMLSAPSMTSGSSATSSAQSFRSIQKHSVPGLEAVQIRQEPKVKAEEPPLLVNQHTANAASSNLTFHAIDGYDAKSLEALFDSTLLFRTKGFTNNATVQFFSSQCSAESGADSTSSSSPNGSNKSTTPNAATVTPASSNSSNGKRKLADLGRENSDDNENNGGDDNNKRQKPLDKTLTSVLDQKLSCPFRKYCPTKYGLRNTRYASCATGSWKDISHLKDSHIYRVHLAHCTGCKTQVKTLSQFVQHQEEAALLNMGSGCNAYEGLFEHEILALKDLKIKGLGRAASWGLLYRSLFPNTESEPFPSPWYTSPCDSQCQPGHDKELQRMMPDEIAAFMESQFMALYNNISSNKPEILEFLMGRLRKRRGEVVPDIETEPTIEATLEQPRPHTELGNGEGPSSRPWGPIAQPNDQLTNETIQDFSPSKSSTGPVLGIDIPDLFQDFETAPSAGINLQGLHQRPDYQTGWFDGQRDGHAAGWNDGHEEGYNVGWNAGHEKGYLDGQREGYKAGKKAAEEGRMSAFSRPNG